MPFFYLNPDDPNCTRTLPTLEVFCTYLSDFEFQAKPTTWMEALILSTLRDAPGGARTVQLIEQIGDNTVPDDDIEEADEAMSELAAAQERLSGWYYRICLPGCMPESDPCGPYETDEKALAAARALFGSDE